MVTPVATFFCTGEKGVMNTQDIYLDNAATTKMLPEVKEALIQDCGNPSAIHAWGVSAEAQMYHAKQQIADTLKVDADEIYFTSGGTESNNLAIHGIASCSDYIDRDIFITTAIEHASVRQTMNYVTKLYCGNLKIISNNQEGLIDINELQHYLNQYHHRVCMVSIMMVNNEIGTVQDIAKIGELIKRIDPKIVFHVDAVQAYGKLPIAPHSMNIDLLSVSGHKINGPKGSGFLYIRKGLHILPVILGGGQQNGMRSGTENMNGIIGLGIAAEIANNNLNNNMNKLSALREKLITGISTISGAHINGSTSSHAPHIVSATIDGVNGENLLHALSLSHVYISTGSACSSNGIKHLSPTLLSLGLQEEEINSTVRFSLGIYNTPDEIDIAIKELKAQVNLLRHL